MRVAQAYLELAVLVRALAGLDDAARIALGARPLARSGPASSTCARTCSAGRVDDLRALAAVAAPSIAVVGSVNLDLVARCASGCRGSGETLTDATFARLSRAARARIRPSRPRGSGARVGFVGAVGEDAFADEALAGLREAGVELELRHGDAPTGVALILVDGDGENDDRGRAGRERAGRPTSSRRPNVLCQLEIPDETVVSAAQQRRSLLPQRRAGPADPGGGRARGRAASSSTATSSTRCRRRRACWRSRSARRAPS